MRVAVTGAAGRVGSGVVGLLVSRGHEVVALDRVPPAPPPLGPVRAVALEMSDYDTLCSALAGCDGIVHLAAIPGPGRLSDAEVHDNNVVASYNALRAAVEAGITRICQASSVNAIGAAFSRRPRFDYLPIDEDHPSYTEDPYSLSKWVCEQQADSIARRYEEVSLTSLRLHLVTEDEGRAREISAAREALATKHLWGWTSLASAAGACLLALEKSEPGHRVLLAVSPRHVGPEPAEDLLRKHYPDVPLRRPVVGEAGFFDCARAERALGWSHDAW